MTEVKEGDIFCAKCNKKMLKVVLPSYEYEEGLTLHNVEAFKCKKCKQRFFTEEQAEVLEQKTMEIKKHAFVFVRKITRSGKSLAINIPEDLVNYSKLRQGLHIKIMPLDKNSFIVSKNA